MPTNLRSANRASTDAAPRLVRACDHFPHGPVRVISVLNHTPREKAMQQFRLISQITEPAYGAVYSAAVGSSPIRSGRTALRNPAGNPVGLQSILSLVAYPSCRPPTYLMYNARSPCFALAR